MKRVARSLTAAVLGGLVLCVAAFAGGAAGPAAAQSLGELAPLPPGAETGTRIEMSVDTAAGPVSLLDPAHPVSTHVTGTTGVVVVTLTITPSEDVSSGYRGRLVARDAPYGGYIGGCSKPTVVTIEILTCTFNVPIVRGVNRLDFLFATVGIDPATVHGQIVGESFGAELRVRFLQADGTWKQFFSGSAVEVAGSQTSAVGYSVENTGSLPFVAQGSCSTEPVPPRGVLVCELRGPRPGYALTGRYEVPLQLVDATGLPVVFTIDGRVALTSGEPNSADAAARGAWAHAAVPDAAIAAAAIIVIGVAVPLALALRRRLRRLA